MALAFTILCLLAYFPIAYFVVTKLLIPATQIWIKAFDALVLAGILGTLIYVLVKLL